MMRALSGAGSIAGSMAGAAALALSLGGCIAKTALDVATLPVKAGGKVIDWTTTSRAEADRNEGRRMRRQKQGQEQGREPS